MKSLFTFIFILLLSLTTGCQNQDVSCEKYKTGTFKYKDSDYEGHTIIRNDSIQIEYNSKDDIKIISKIEWISNCEFILTYKDILNYPNKEDVIGEKINVKIVKTKESSYICEVKSNSLDSTIEIIKIK